MTCLSFVTRAGLSFLVLAIWVGLVFSGSWNPEVPILSIDLLKVALSLLSVAAVAFTWKAKI